MNGLQRPFILIATAALVVAACGGGSGSASSTTPGPTLATIPSAETATSSTGTEASPGATPGDASTPPPTGGGPSDGVCELVTTGELASIFGVPSVTTKVFIGPPDSCSVISDSGDPLVAWSYSNAQAAVVYDAVVLPGQSVDVPGIGDKAAIVENTGLLVLKGNVLVVISVQSGDDELAKKVARAAAGRM